MFDDDRQAWSAFAYTALAALSGSITALSVSGWQKRTWIENVLTVATSASFAMFFAPWFVHEIWHMNEDAARAGAFVTYISAAGAPVLIPKVVGMLSGLLSRLPGSGDGK
jgi:hypothetical protein